MVEEAVETTENTLTGSEDSEEEFGSDLRELDMVEERDLGIM